MSHKKPSNNPTGKPSRQEVVAYIQPIQNFCFLLEQFLIAKGVINANEWVEYFRQAMNPQAAAPAQLEAAAPELPGGHDGAAVIPFPEAESKAWSHPV